MSEYKGIKGFTTQTVSTDPAASIYATGTWSSGGSLNTAVNASGGSNAGSQTASINFAGNAAPYPTVTTATESYNGTSWSPVNNMNTARWILSSFGPQTAAVGVGGVTDVNAVLPTAVVEQWNGTCWTEVAELATERYSSGGFGTGTAALIVGGASRPGAAPGVPVIYRANVEAWNGTSWTAGTAINTARASMFSFGINTSGLVADGALDPGNLSNAESWNGSSWTEVTETNTTRRAGGAAGSSNTLGLIFGGYGTAYGAQTEIWDGTSWTELNDLATARSNVQGSGSVPSALAFAGSNPPIGSALTATEEWTITATPTTFSKENLGQVYYNSTSGAFKVTQQPASAGAWSSGGSLNTARRIISGAGTQTATVAMGGYVPPWVGNAELYNGSTWTTTTSINTIRSGIESAGTQTAAIGAGGYDGTTRLAVTEEWNGTSWTEVNDLNVGRSEGGSSINGTTTATIVFSGAADPPTPTSPKSTESYNGTCWTEVGDLSGPHIIGTGFGTQTAAIAAAGEPLLSTAELWNGTSWSSVSPINTARAENLGSGGLSTSGLIFGGFTATFVGNTESWNGSAWTEVADLATARDSLYGSGISSSALAFGGRTGPTTASAATEEWIVPIQNNTITVS